MRRAAPNLNRSAPQGSVSSRISAVFAASSCPSFRQDQALIVDPIAMWQTPIGRREAAQPSPMKRSKIFEAISPLTKSRHPAKTPPRHCSARGHRDKTRSLYRARPQVRERVFQRIVASILNYRGSNAPASFILSAEFLPGLHLVLIQALSSSHSHSNDDKRSLDQSGLGTHSLGRCARRL